MPGAVQNAGFLAMPWDQILIAYAVCGAATCVALQLQRRFYSHFTPEQEAQNYMAEVAIKGVRQLFAGFPNFREPSDKPLELVRGEFSVLLRHQ